MRKMAKDDGTFKDKSYASYFQENIASCDKRKSAYLFMHQQSRILLSIQKEAETFEQNNSCLSNFADLNLRSDPQWLTGVFIEV